MLLNMNSRGISRTSARGAGASIVAFFDDDAHLWDTMRELLEAAGFGPVFVQRAPNALRVLQRARPALIVINSPRGNVDSCGLIRRLYIEERMPAVIMLARTPDPVERAVAIEMGADDCMDSAGSPGELLARIRAVLRRCRPEPDAGRAVARDTKGQAHFGAFRFDPLRGVLYRLDQPVHITPAECELLQLFLERPGQILSRAEIFAAIEGCHSPDSLSVLVWRLRSKIEDNPRVPVRVQSVRGRGYLFVPAE
ncbi:response regulator transcription factor [Paraburkholderia tropica]|uniref:response regulator transcription factor n=1 Tax=Paraburkholderia tropica TaxID=92647 RepID=UPI002AB62948|nr:response regulator transcription factor [Paraburkholderia tropica]